MPDLPQHPFTSRQLAELGVSRSDLDSWLRDGQVRRVLRGAFVRSEAPDTIDTRAEAAALLLPEHVVLCDRSAAWVWGIDVLDLHEHSHPPRLETASMPGHDRVRHRSVYGGKRDLLAEEVVTVNGIRVTTPLRTACDLACLRGRRSALAVYDAFRREHDLTCVDFDRMLRRFKGRRGVIQARELAPYAIGESESVGESWCRMDIIDAGLRPPEAQVWVELPGIGMVRLDLAYRWLKIAIEYDGAEHHTSIVDRERDQRRRDALRAAGWVVIVVTKDDFRPGADGSWLAALRTAIDERVPAYRRQYSRGEARDPRR